MHCVYPLKSRFHAITQEKYINTLFHDTLKIKNAGVVELLSELHWVKHFESPSYSLAIDVYGEVNRRRPNIDGSIMNEIRYVT